MSEIKHEAYCFRCKAKKEVRDPEIVTMKTGMKSVKGTCTECGGNMYKILPKNNVVE